MPDVIATRAELEARITQLRDKQRRLPVHWEKRREEIAAQIEVLVLDWLAADG